MERCWTCQAYIATDDEKQSKDGLWCPNCGDEVPAAELELNGYEYNGAEWVYSK